MALLPNEAVLFFLLSLPVKSCVKSTDAWPVSNDNALQKIKIMQK